MLMTQLKIVDSCLLLWLVLKLADSGVLLIMSYFGWTPWPLRTLFPLLGLLAISVASWPAMNIHRYQEMNKSLDICP